MSSKSRRRLWAAVLASGTVVVSSSTALADNTVVLEDVCWYFTDGSSACASSIVHEGSCSPGTQCEVYRAVMPANKCSKVVDKIETYVSNIEGTTHPTFWLFDPTVNPANWRLTVPNGWDYVILGSSIHQAIHDTALKKSFNGTIAWSNAFGYVDHGEQHFIWVKTDCS
jgi:hypothetical protein